MFFDIDPSNGIPIYDQVVRQMKFAIAQETLRPGDRVPSVRDLARDLLVNPNTIARSYQALQTEGILEAIRGIGFEVARGAKSECQRQRKAMFRERLSQVLREAHLSGLAADEIEKIYQQSLSQAQSTRKTS